MTVESVSDGYAVCIYVDEFGDVKRHEVSVAVLKVVGG